MAAERFPMIPYSRKRLTKAEMISSVRAFADVLATRRSVRQFSSEDVPDEVLRLAIAIAASALSGGRDILERPENEKAFLLIPVGYPADDCRVPDIRKSSSLR
jgi:nitroreductase